MSLPRPLLVALAAVLLSLMACGGPGPTPTPPFGLAPLVLPADEAAHDVQTEWWYFNVHLWDDGPSQRRWALHQVLFQVQETQSGRTLYVAQAGLADAISGTYAVGERLRTEAAVLPSITDGFNFEVGGWRFEGTDGVTYALRADIGGATVDLALRSAAPALRHGADGLVDFGSAGVSYYYTRPRLEVSGTLVTAQGERFTVAGMGWLDKQWGDFQPVAVSWDWASIQLDDGRDLMLTRLLGPQGDPIDGYGSLQLEAGLVRLAEGDFAFEPVGPDAWQSPESGARYATRWRIVVPSEAIDIELVPLVQASEFRSAVLGVVYWEAGVEALDSADRRVGQGFVELTGRAGLPVPAGP